MLAALSGAASAATTVSLSATRLTVIGEIGRNDLRVRREPGRYRVSDTAGALVARAPCVRVGADVDCQSSAEVALVRVELRAGADRVERLNVHAAAQLFGQDGSDALRGGLGADALDGGDDLAGRGGQDTLDGRRGPDALDGGDGPDTLVYPDRSAGVRVDLADRRGRRPSRCRHEPDRRSPAATPTRVWSASSAPAATNLDLQDTTGGLRGGVLLSAAAECEIQNVAPRGTAQRQARTRHHPRRPPPASADRAALRAAVPSARSPQYGCGDPATGPTLRPAPNTGRIDPHDDAPP
jgi:hypothetical protein